MSNPALPGLPTAREQACPKCEAQVPLHPGYDMWCDQCGWNLTLPPSSPPSLFGRLSGELSKRLGAGLQRELSAQPTRRPGWSLATTAALVIAAVIGAISLGLFVLGGYALVVVRPLVAGGTVALLSWGVAWLLAPRVPHRPRVVLDRAAYPQLYALADKVSRALGAPPIHAITVDDEFNAAFWRAGWRGRPVLRLGMPLWAALGPDERVALVAHEIAHDVNGDPVRGWLIASTVNGLGRLYSLLRPPRTVFVGQGVMAALLWITRLLMWLASLVPLALAMLLSQLLWRDSQRAEYCADALAATVSGKQGALALLEKLAYAPLYADTVRRVAFAQRGQPLVSTWQRRVAEAPPRERERLRRLEAARPDRLDNTHPPAAQRSAFIRARPDTPPLVTLTPDEQVQLEQEAAPLYGELERVAFNR